MLKRMKRGEPKTLGSVLRTEPNGPTLDRENCPTIIAPASVHILYLCYFIREGERECTGGLRGESRGSAPAVIQLPIPSGISFPDFYILYVYIYIWCVFYFVMDLGERGLGYLTMMAAVISSSTAPARFVMLYIAGPVSHLYFMFVELMSFFLCRGLLGLVIAERLVASSICRMMHI